MMQLVWRMIRSQLGTHWKGLAVVVIITAGTSATPYGFAMLGRWLVDDVLQVGAPAAPAAEQDILEGAGVEEPEGLGPAAAVELKSPEERLRLLVLFLLASIGIHVAVTGASAVSEVIRSRINNGVIYSLRTAIHRKLASMELAVFRREQVGQLMTRVLDDISGIPGHMTQLVVNAITQTLMLVLGLVLLVRLNAAMTAIVLFVLPFYAVTCAVFLPRIKRNTEDLRDRVAALSGFVIERLSNVLTVKNYAQEERESDAFAGKVDENLRLSRRQHRLDLLFSTLTTVITGLGVLTVLAMGFLNIRTGRMQLGEVLAFHGVTAQLFVPISAMVGLLSTAQTLGVLSVRVFTILDTPAGITDPDDPADVNTLHGQIDFEGVSMQYHEGGPFALRGVDLSIPAGTAVCIVGRSGSGKSTLLGLVTRMYDPSSGTVKLDGTDLRRFPVRDLRRAVGNVLHHCPVFTGTIADNIAYGRPDAAAEDIEKTARLVGLDEFIRSLDDGYRTQLGRGGIQMSNDQLARLGLARALLTHPAILTIDDTFSAFEPEEVKALREAVRLLLHDRTILLATSQLEMCRDADLVVVMQQGSIVQLGTFDELLEQPGTFRRMYLRQAGLQE